MIFGIGIDIIEISRVKALYDEYGDEIVRKLFTEKEISYCMGKAFPERSFSARFSAKEAFLKALGTGLSSGISWKQIEIENAESGKPNIVCDADLQNILNEKKISNIHLSIAHSENYAVAMVVLETIS